jgi:hypothetical protein
MYSLKGDLRSTLAPFLKEAWRVFAISLGHGRITSRVRLFHNFFVHLRKINRNHGDAYTVKYLKACSVATQRVISGSPYRSLRDLHPDIPFPRLYSGLPACIGLSDRKLIRQGHPHVIRFWLTVFGIFRVLKAPVKANISTITDPYSGGDLILTEFSLFIKDYFWTLLSGFFSPSSVDLSAVDVLVEESSGPNGTIAGASIFSDLFWIINNPDIKNLFLKYIKLSKSNIFELKFKDMIRSLERALEEGAKLPIKGRFVINGSINKPIEKVINGERFTFVNPTNLENQFYGGQLSFKEEAAGKLRVFAMVDIWTQSLLKPLHHSIFNLLRKLPNDGTFNQEEAFNRAIEKSIYYGHAWSVDLSSATDRLPIEIQKYLVSALTGSKVLAETWASLLVSRDYVITGDISKLASYGLEPQRIRYAVGQPMGALSSWAMLALTHHFIVQYSVYRARGQYLGWYPAYEILGDDIVLFEHDIYLEYLQILSELGVPANAAKSIPSPNRSSCEFAKRSSLDDHDVSGLSWKEFFQGNNLPGKINLILRFYGRNLLANDTLYKVLLCRFNSEVAKPVSVKAHHGIVSVLGSLLTRSKLSLNNVLLTLINPELCYGEVQNKEDFSPFIPYNQVVRLIRLSGLKLNSVSLEESISKGFLSNIERRQEILDKAVLPYLKDLVKSQAIRLLRKAKVEEERNRLSYVNMCIDDSEISNGCKMPIRSFLRITLFQNANFDTKIREISMKLDELARHGKEIDPFLDILSDIESFSTRFKVKAAVHGTVPVDNKLALLFSKIPGKQVPYWEIFHSNLRDILNSYRAKIEQVNNLTEGNSK